MTFLLIYFIIGLANVIWDWDSIAKQYNVVLKVFNIPGSTPYLVSVILVMCFLWPINLYWFIAGMFRR